MLAQLWLKKGILFYIYCSVIIAVIVIIVSTSEPDKLKEGCDLGSDIECLDYNIGATGAVIALQNNLDEDIVLESARLNGCQTNYSGLEVESGEMTHIVIEGCEIENDHVISDLEVVYKPKNKVRPIPVTGRIAGMLAKNNIYTDYYNIKNNGNENEISQNISG